MSTALLTDHYELTMVSAALASGAAGRRVVFEVFARSLPPGRRYGVFAGTGRLLEALAEFQFGPAEIELLLDRGVVDEPTASWLTGFSFGGDVHAYAEGEPYLPDTPVLVVEGTFAECVLLETLVLSILNYDSAVAAAAARMVAVADGRPCLEMGSRRTHEQAAVAAARVAYLVGFEASSNLEAARRYGVPTVGTSAHAFTLVHDSEAAAFEAQVATLGSDTTLLVDTYEVAAGLDAAVAAAGTGLGAVRLDSGDPVAGVAAARERLDRLGATGTRIVVTGDLDEYAIAGLAASPVDGYGVGTRLVTGSGAPTAGFVYKLVEVDGQPVAKTSVGKATRGGRKEVLRRRDAGGTAIADLVSTITPASAPPAAKPPAAAPPAAAPAAVAAGAGTDAPDAEPADGAGEQPTDMVDPTMLRDRPLLAAVVRGGKLVDGPTDPAEALGRARAHHAAAMAELPSVALDIEAGPPCLPVVRVEHR